MNRFSASVKRYTDDTASAVRADAILYVAILLYFVVGVIYVSSMSGMLFGDYSDYVRGCVILCCLVLPYVSLILGVIRITFRLRGRHRLAYRYMFSPRRLSRMVAGTLLMVLILVLFEEMFTSIKSAFSNSGFGYDAAFANIDKFLHFGHAPVKWLLPAQSDLALRIIEFNYDEVWVTIWLGMLYWIVTSPRADGVRIRYCLTFFLVWAMVGNVAAGLFPTAGPAFYGLVTGDMSRFAKLHAFLDGSSSATALTQRYLWSLHQQGISGLGAGISAFPSMHVAITAMGSLFMAERHPRLGVIGAVYTGVIMVSSVYLGWHYAIDGYVAVLMTIGIYSAMRYGPALFTLPAVRRVLQGVPGRRSPGLAEA